MKRLTARRLASFDVRRKRLYQALDKVDLYFVLARACLDWQGAPRPHPDEALCDRRLRRAISRVEMLAKKLGRGLRG